MPAAAGALELALPLACEPHRTCFIQSYVDVDPGPAVRDYACGQATYQEHSGVDFRVLSAAVATKADVPVIASADGTVKGLRDGVPDVFYKETAKADVKGRECGNGVLLEHADGYETQYCHLRNGSVRVTKGQTVKRGDVLGAVGFSGMADFAHVHLAVRHNGKTIDPFAPNAEPAACKPDARGPGLWEPAAAAAFPYRNGEIIAAAFAGEPPDHAKLEADHQAVAPLTRDAPALLIYGRMINLRKDDRVRLVATGPGGTIVDDVSDPIERSKATFVSYAGKKRGDMPWAPGRYEGRVELIRDGGVIASAPVTVELR